MSDNIEHVAEIRDAASSPVDFEACFGKAVPVLGDCFFPPDRRTPADVAIIFGMSKPHRPVELATEIFRSGLAKRLLFTGGFNSRLSRSEAEFMADLARARGVPADAILVEKLARNTEENVRFSLEIMNNHHEFADVNAIMLVTIHYHLRRAYIASRRCFPSSVSLSWSCYKSIYYDDQNWFRVEQGRRDVRTEIDKINRYYGVTLAELLRQEV